MLKPYLLYLTYPLSVGYEDRPSYKSKIQVGRQLLTEGFEIEILDGIYLPYYLSHDLKVWLYGGVVHIPDELKINSKDQLYGSSLGFKKWQIHFKLGAHYKKYQDYENGLLYITILRSLPKLMFQPIVLAKGEWGTDEQDLRQGLIDINFRLIKEIKIFLGYSKRQPVKQFELDKYLYRLLAIFPQTSYYSKLRWLCTSNLSSFISYEKFSYQSPVKDIPESSNDGTSTGSFSGRKEVAEKIEVSGVWRLKSTTVTSYIMTLYSYGGSLIDWGSEIKYVINPLAVFRLEGDIARIKKINSITGMAYHLRTGFDFHLGKNWLALLAVEIERNYMVEIDTRAVFYVSHFAF